MLIPVAIINKFAFLIPSSRTRRRYDVYQPQYEIDDEKSPRANSHQLL